MKYSDLDPRGKEIEIPNLLGGNRTIHGREKWLAPIYREFPDGIVRPIYSHEEHERLIKEWEVK